MKSRAQRVLGLNSGGIFARISMSGTRPTRWPHLIDFGIRSLAHSQHGLELCEASGFKDAKSHVRLAEMAAKEAIDHTNFSGLEAHLLRIEQAIINDAWQRKLLLVPVARAGYVDSAEGLMGAAVLKSFPSATNDLREAGNCLAADCNTAAVFHLMRVAEWGLKGVRRSPWDSLYQNTQERRQVQADTNSPCDLGRNPDRTAITSG